MAELTNELQIAIRTALDEAQHRRQEFAGTEHLLLALLCDQVSARAVRRCGGNVESIKSELDSFLRDHIPRVPDHMDVEAAASVGFHAAIQRAVINAQTSERQKVAGPHVLIAMYALEDCHAVYLLKSQGVSRIGLMEYVSHGGLNDGGPLDDESEDEGFSAFGVDDEGDDEELAPEQALERFTTNLNIEAEEGRIDPMIGRTNELDRCIHILSRRRKNNPIFVGEAGVGKTAIVEGLARAIHSGETPKALKDAQVFSLDVGALIAGTRYRGDFENRVKAVLRQLETMPDAILFVDEIHTLIGAGAASGGALDASTILKPLLARGQIRCIGATTWREYRNIFERDQALARRFQKIEVGEPSVEETREILKGISNQYEVFHGIKFTEDALNEAAELGGRYLNDRFLPDKAIDIIDEAAASVKLKGRKTVEVEDIEQTIARMASIPPKSVGGDDRHRLAELENELAAAIFGQDEAVKQLASAVKMGRSGLAHPDKPIGSFLFTGPTGVGKTEVCRQLARILNLELIRFDMSEYMERHTVSRLIGAPPGYVGYDQGGLLTDAIAKTPHSVLLLDEIEKAHPDVFNLLLQVMDHGSLTDNNGKKTDFRNVIVVMTSNIGARDLQRTRPGFSSLSENTSGDDEPAYKRLFSPEFRNRLDARIRFETLKPEVMDLIAQKFIDELAAQLLGRKVEMECTDAARSHLAKIGFDPKNGARPMDRAIRQHIRQPLADELLFGNLADGGRLRIDVDGEKFVFEFPDSKSKKKKKTSAAKGKEPVK
jgi:ATP-dependent Clp protease ATP-binding subunit ClpA